VDRGQPGSRHHLITDAGGIPLAVLPTAVTATTSRNCCRCCRRCHRSAASGTDRGSVPIASTPTAATTRQHRQLVRDHHVMPVIARRGAEHGCGLGKVRWVVEQTLALLHSFRRLRIRWEICLSSRGGQGVLRRTIAGRCRRLYAAALGPGDVGPRQRWGPDAGGHWMCGSGRDRRVTPMRARLTGTATSMGHTMVGATRITAASIVRSSAMRPIPPAVPRRARR
jgi:hypothetical protein